MEKTISMPVSIYALGGLGEVGKNMYCVENDKTLIIIDAGVRFPGSELPGVDYVIPDYTHLKNNRNKVKALFITHGHEDHIGAIPFLLQTINVPVIYAPRLAAALIKTKLEEHRLSERVKIVIYDRDTVVNVDTFKVSFIQVTHSIPDAFGICVDTTEGRIITTGDFKVDLTPIGADIELNKFARLGEEGVDLLLSDSTNAETEGHTPSEKNVLSSIEEVFDSVNGRLIISTFASNISRIQQICEVAVSHKRKITIVGRSMEKAVQTSRSFGYIHIPDDSIIDVQDIKLYKNSELLILCTGSQGEAMAALSRIAKGEHKDIHIQPGDTVVFSSSAIPGNTLMISRMVNLLSRCGADVITNSILNDIHSSGHPGKQELRLILKLVKPKYFMPVHGEYRMLRIHSELAQELGMAKDNCFVLDNGDTLQLSKKKITLGYKVEAGNTYIDGKDISGLAEQVIDDRIKLSEDGMVAIAIYLDSVNNKILKDPEIYMKGVISQGSKTFEQELKTLIKNVISQRLIGKTNFNELKTVIRQYASEYASKKLNTQPMIIPVIMTKKHDNSSK